MAYYVNSIIDFLAGSLTSKNLPFQEEEESLNLKRYFPNHCHICHCLDKKEHRLKRCCQCQLVSYCGQDHQAKDWKQHKELCKALTELGGPKLFDDLKNMQDPPNASMQTRIELAKERGYLKNVLFSKLTSKLKRKPFLYEMQIFTYPRICAVCFENDPRLLVCCSNCPQSSFCVKHREDSSHSKICWKLKLGSEIELDDLGQDIFEEELKEVKFICQKKGTPLPSSMKDFLTNNSYVQVKRDNTQEVLLTPDLFNVYLSEAVSAPLTLVYVIKKLKLQAGSDLTLHVIGATETEVENLKWELILHWMPNVTYLRIFFFGSEMKEIGKIHVEVCESCKRKNANLDLQFYSGLYQDYDVPQPRLKPLFVAAFNAGIHAYKSWIPALRKIANLKKPFVQTSYTKMEAYRDHKWITDFMPNVRYQSLEPNPFASFNFERNSDDEARE